MPKAKFTQAAIKGISVTLGEILKRIDDESENFAGSPEQLQRIKTTIGLNERRVAAPGTTAADLCERAARRLFEKTELDIAKVDGLICVTQTPDYFQPCNAAILHGRFGMEKNCVAFDINLGCSGWVVGLYTAFLMIESGGCENVILLAGDTISKCVNPKDRAVAPLFGDAGSATLVTRSPMNSWFSLHTNGQGCGFIQVPGGAFRQPSCEETKKESADADGNIRSLENLYMNGAEVFNFSIKEEPAAIREILEFSGKSIEEIDWIVFHQANKYIIGNIARRLKVPLEKVPCGAVEKFGNQSSASIPATICSEIKSQIANESQRLIFSGFGVGLSWATCVIETPPIVCDLE